MHRIAFGLTLLLPFLLPQLAATAAAQDEVGVYAVDASNSDIHWRIYSAGTFARLGHNHVISAADVQGMVYLDANLAESRFELEIPVMMLVVDDPQLRSLYGEEFASEPSAKDIAGTRVNMLSEKVLDAEQYAALRISGRGPSSDGGETKLDLTVELLGRSVPLSVPVTLDVEGDTLEVAGTFRLNHADLGMQPFSVMLGALQVAEPIDFSYRVRATRVTTPESREERPGSRSE